MAGIIAKTFAGALKNVRSALVGGFIVGTILAAGEQWAFSTNNFNWIFIIFSGIALAIGNAIGSYIVHYSTNLKSLMIVGAISGVILGLTQGIIISNPIFGLIVAIFWLIGWASMSIIKVDVDRQYHIFGMVGALFFTIALAILTKVGWVRF